MPTPTRVLYLDPFSGVSGDMFVGALLDLGADLARLHHEIAKLKLSGVRLGERRVVRGSLTAIKFDVEVHGRIEGPGDVEPNAPEPPGGVPHIHRPYRHIRAMIDAAGFPARVTERCQKVFRKLAEAEGRVHGMNPDDVEFHEVGAVDSIVDITASCLALEQLSIDEVWTGPIALGSGFVRCAHGMLAVPAPATAELVKGLPLRASPVEKELTTPTGAALAAALSVRSGPLQGLRMLKVGYGAGTREKQVVPNVLRAVLGEAEAAAGGVPADSERDEVVEFQANLDDSTGEVLGHLAERLFAAGALDVFFAPIQMKKMRPGTLLTVLATPAESEKMVDLIFRESTTFGIRQRTLERRKLSREWVEVGTAFGAVRVKVGRWRGEEVGVHPEYEDCRARAAEHNVPLKAVEEAARIAYRQREGK